MNHTWDEAEARIVMREVANEADRAGHSLAATAIDTNLDAASYSSAWRGRLIGVIASLPGEDAESARKRVNALEYSRVRRSDR